MHLHIDFINPDGNFATVNDVAKIAANLDLMPHLAVNIRTQQKNGTGPFSSLTVWGRWLVLYQANRTDPFETRMYFIDFRVDLMNSYPIFSQILSEPTIAGLRQIQLQYDRAWSEHLDYIELTVADPGEVVMVPNLFACFDDTRVLAKAKTLGVLPMLESPLQGADRGAKVVLVDEKAVIGGDPVTHLYALLHWSGHPESRSEENGYSYLRIYDFRENIALVPSFFLAVEKAGGTIDRAVFLDRFGPHNLN